MKSVAFFSVLLSGLVAGLFYAYSCSVNPGLRALSDSDYLKSMQSINSAIQNPIFFTAFMGLLLVYPIAVYQSYQHAYGNFAWVLASAIIYYVFVFGITVIANVPLNEQLAAFTIDTSSVSEISAMRKAFENPWNFFHTIRTYASVICFGLTIAAFLIKK